MDKAGSQEVKKSGRAEKKVPIRGCMSYPIFLTSDLPIFESRVS
jgi:hypothetical protein